jgi:hypothetical protein
LGAKGRFEQIPLSHATPEMDAASRASNSRMRDCPFLGLTSFAETHSREIRSTSERCMPRRDTQCHGHRTLLSGNVSCATDGVLLHSLSRVPGIHCIIDFVVFSLRGGCNTRDSKDSYFSISRIISCLAVITTANALGKSRNGTSLNVNSKKCD